MLGLTTEIGNEVTLQSTPVPIPVNYWVHCSERFQFIGDAGYKHRFLPYRAFQN